MKKIILIVTAFLYCLTATAQDKNQSKADLVNRAGDHFMVQLSSDHWIGSNDSITSHLKGLSRGANVHVMLNKPFKSNPSLSVAFGIGVGTSNIYFKNMGLDIKATGNNFPFNRLDTVNRFKKYKLTTAYLEVPIELRFTANPQRENKSIKFALGGKVGTLLNAHTKGKTLQDRTGKTLNSFTAKETSKKFFNSTRMAVTARVGYGNFTLFGSYQVNNMFKDVVAPETRLLQVGLCLSGL
ncbi:MAG: PorT family protein [Chitinophagaceae bacterium]|nr:PorT family protein [Chitinophagaceae bacterium]